MNVPQAQLPGGAEPTARPAERATHAAAPARRAFSLMELLVVMMILAILSAISLPAARALARSNGRAQAANQVRATLGVARSIAISQHRQAGVVFFEETPAFSRPVNGGQTAMHIFVEDFDQAKYNPLEGNTVYVAYSTARQYLPAGIRVASLNDDPNREMMTGDEQSATNSRGITRAVLFDSGGQMITRNGMARPDIGSGKPGSYPRAYGEWNFTTKRGDAHMGVSSPGIFLIDSAEYAAQKFKGGLRGAAQDAEDARRTSWIKQNADLIVLNPNTGALLR